MITHVINPNKPYNKALVMCGMDVTIDLSHNELATVIHAVGASMASFGEVMMDDEPLFFPMGSMAYQAQRSCLGIRHSQRQILRKLTDLKRELEECQQTNIY